MLKSAIPRSRSIESLFMVFVIKIVFMVFVIKIVFMVFVIKIVFFANRPHFML